MLKKHRQLKKDPLQTRSNISELPVGYGGTSPKWKENQKKFEDLSKKFEDLKKQGGTSDEAPGFGQMMNGIGTVASGFTAMNNSTNPTSLAIRNSISDFALKSGDPTLMAIGAATKVIDAFGDATGFHLDDIEKDTAKRAGIGDAERVLNNAMNAIPGMSTVMSVFTGKNMDNVALNDDGRDVISSYTGSEADINTGNKLAGKRNLFGANRSNRFITKANQQAETINEIGRVNALAKQSDYATNLAQQNLNRYAGTNYQMHAVGKKGMKIMSRRELQEILAKQKLQKGGVIGTDTNLLPEGALHARLNHLNDVNPDLEDATKKGIPVLDANGNQIAEIEKEELIFRLELTQKIEELMKDGSEEAMIEAGKLLASELIENTQDNTGQITEEVENGK